MLKGRGHPNNQNLDIWNQCLVLNEDRMAQQVWVFEPRDAFAPAGLTGVEAAVKLVLKL